ncbi:MAG: WD40 repeat domain-containing protein [Deltaproteobacteria bacterium]
MNPQALWIYLGVGGPLLVLVVLAIKAVGPPAAPEAEAPKVSQSVPSGSPPPVRTSSVAAHETKEKSTLRKKTESRTDVETASRNAEPQATRASHEAEPDEPKIAVEHDTRPWKADVDPPDKPFEFDPKKKIIAVIPKNSTGDVIFPDCPSPFVALGSNNALREIREVRDLQGNRRLGAVRSAVITNARVALSPDGQQFAAWPAGQNRIGVWTVKTEKPRGMIPVAGSAVPRLLMFAGNERLIALGGGDELFVWVMPEGRLYGTVSLPRIAGAVVAGLSPGGRLLALAVADAKEPSLRILDLATGNVAGEISLSRFTDKPPVCHAVAFSPDGAELAVLCESREESNLLAFHAATGELAAQITTDDSLRTSLNAGNWQGGRALEWFPSRQRWLVYGQGVIDRAAGRLVWTLPRDKSGAIQIGHVLDDERLLVLGTEKQEAALVAREVPPR